MKIVEKFYTYHRHGVAYKALITPGMTKDMMRAIYKVTPFNLEWQSKLDEKEMFYVQFPETTYTKMTREEWEAKGKPEEIMLIKVSYEKEGIKNE